jgi:tetratricopeptide (TPR) repeat protein
MSEDPSDYHNTGDLISRFEQMIQQNESYYFDVEQLEAIIDGYQANLSYQKAIKALEYAYSLFPDNTALIIKEVQLLSGIGQLSKALSRLKVLEKFEPNNEEMLLTMAAVYSQLREHNKAIQYYKRALQICSEEEIDDVYLEIALEYENLEQYEKAIDTLKKGIERSPENETLLYEIAFCFELAGLPAVCAMYFQQFIDEHPYSFAAWYNLGNAFQKLDKSEDSIEAYDYCLAIQSDFAPAYYNKAHALFKLEKYAEALEVLEESYVHEPPQAPIFCHVGECFEKLNDYDKALFYYHKSIETDEYWADAYLGIGVVMDLQGKLAEAIPFLDKAIDLESKNPDYAIYKMEVLVKMEKFTEAISLGEKLVKEFPENEETWMALADAFFKFGNNEKALETMLDATLVHLSNPDIGFRRAVYLIELGKIQDAQELLHYLMQNESSQLSELEEYYPKVLQLPFYIQLKSDLGLV